MRAKSDLTDQSECGLPYSVFGGLAVNSCSLQLQTRHSQSCFDCCDSHLLGSQERTDEPLNATMRLWRRDLLLQWKFTAMLQGIRWAYSTGWILSYEFVACSRVQGIDSREQHTEPNTPCSVLVLAFRHPRLYFTHPPSLYNNIYLRLQSTEDTAQGLCVCVYCN